MLYPAESFANLVEALILLPAAAFTFTKLYEGSKSKFAYLLTAFTLAFGLCRLAWFIINLIPNKTTK